MLAGYIVLLNELNWCKGEHRNCLRKNIEVQNEEVFGIIEGIK